MQATTQTTRKGAEETAYEFLLDSGYTEADLADWDAAELIMEAQSISDAADASICFGSGFQTNSYSTY